ncbi:MAG: hypothetical protein KME27_08645 [Lyngbya sp. HA4199-MV5]|jgi:hypothetical protein|nr:hypothetical protein [Lyngbya sp. HA4199-MV5]
MKILEHTTTRLVIKDGSRWHTSSPMHGLLTLVSDKWQTVIKGFSLVASLSLGVAWLTGKIPTTFQPVAAIVLFLLGAPLLLELMTGEAPPTYVFDKSSGQMTITHGKFTQRFDFSEVVNVLAVNTEAIDSPPTFWREIHLILRSGQALKLHPGHDQPEQQAALTILIQQFLGLSQP